MKVEPSGVVMIGVCDVQTPKCKAKAASAITAVWTLPGRSQINVCHECMEEMVRVGEWEIPQSRISLHADVAVLNQHSRPVLVIEVKRRPYYDEDLLGFAVRVHRNMVMHSAIPSRGFFMLALFPSPFYLWRPDSALEPTTTPDFEIRYEREMLRRRHVAAVKPDDEHKMAELVIANWVKDVLLNPPDEQSEGVDWLYASGLLDSIRKGRVVTEWNP